jgi:NAD-dependent dihydropyrimidine dehydrogenase PreA subunit
MYNLPVHGKECVGCGICVDVCGPQAIAMRTKSARKIEGSRLTYLRLQSPGNRELATAEMGTFPYLRVPALCNGCARCVAECPVMALELHPASAPATIEKGHGRGFSLPWPNFF